MKEKLAEVDQLLAQGEINLYGNKVEKGYSAKVILHTYVDKLKAIGCVTAI
jgi:hypothetical protein